MKRAKSVEEYLEFNEKDRPMLEKLRSVVLSTGIEECIKWGVPTYTYKKKNVAGLAAFKHYVGVWFHEGALLSDYAGKLINAQEGKTQALRQWRMENEAELDEEVLRAYLLEAMENVDKGKKVSFEKKEEEPWPEELKDALKKDADLNRAFEALTPFKQKEYAEHIASAKREATRISRLEKALPFILQGVGLNDKYRK